MSAVFVILLALIPSLSLANIVYFPLLQKQTQNVAWNCTCKSEEQCFIENFKGQSVLTLPANCDIETTYNYAVNPGVKAIRLQVKTIEELYNSFSLKVSNAVDIPGIYDFKMRVRTDKKNGYYDSITGFSNKKQRNESWLIVSNPQPVPLHLIEAKVDESSKERTGSILAAVGSLQGSYRYEETRPDYAWVPLPLDYKEQVPLYIHLNIKPKRLVQSLQYQVDNLGNWGAAIHFVPNTPVGTKIDFLWDVAVLTSDVEPAKEFEGDVAEWLSPSAIVQSSNSSIQATANSLRDPNSTKKTVYNIVSWLSTHIGQGLDTMPAQLDALHIFEARISTCTGFANLAAALGRALAIPSSTLVVYWVGIQQETHWINEFYLGDGEGWFRVEPQGDINVESENYIAVRIDRVSEEILWQYPKGIPLYAYPIIPLDSDSPYLVEAFNTAEFTDSPLLMNKVFHKARQEWSKDFKRLLETGKISSRRQILRYQLAKAQSLTEVDYLLSQLLGAD